MCGNDLVPAGRLPLFVRAERRMPGEVFARFAELCDTSAYLGMVVDTPHYSAEWRAEASVELAAAEAEIAALKEEYWL